MKNYTVSQLAKLSGVTVRSLHFYDDIGLLKPAFTAQNGYRYYQEPQLLMLQQILFFRELGFELKQIQSILKDGDFDKVTTLQSHKKTLKQEIKRLQALMVTIDKTINHLQGTQTMTEQELFIGLQNFSPELQKKLRDLMKNDAEFKKFADQEYAIKKDWNKQDQEKAEQEKRAFWGALVKAFSAKLKTSSPEVQQLMKQYCQLLKNQGGFVYTSELFIKIAEYMPTMLENHKKAAAQYPEMASAYEKADKMFYDNPGLAEFLADAMKVYAKHN